MRISDWSSDVFSSDLLRGRDLAQLDARGLQLVNVMLSAGLQPVREEDEVAPLNSYLRWLPCVFDPAADKRDRKSVVSGKSGSVRVDLGGRSIMKKNRNK